MHYNERVPDELFNQEGHYLGRPADFDDRIIHRRLRLLNLIPNFVGQPYSLLDIGCGNGATMFGLAAGMKTCLGLEINDDHKPEFERYKTGHNITNCTYQAIDIEHDAFDQQFDRIISFEVIEHLSNEDSVRFYHKALKDDGMLVISVPNKWWIFETHGARLPLLPWNRVPFFSWLPRPIHERFANARIYTKKRISDLLIKHGFNIKDIQYITAPMDVLPKGKFKDFMIKHFFNTDTTIYPYKSTSILVVATKK